MAWPDEDETQEPVNAMPPHDLDRMESNAKLHHEMEKRKARYAYLRARYRNGGCYADLRKTVLSDIRLDVRLALDAGGAKYTEGLIDDSAHADKRYREWMDTAVKEAEEFEKLDLEMAMLRDRIRRSDSLMYVSGRESRLPQS